MARSHHIIVNEPTVKTGKVFFRVHPRVKMEIIRAAKEDGLNMGEYLRRLAEEDLRRRGVSIIAETRQQIV